MAESFCIGLEQCPRTVPVGHAWTATSLGQSQLDTSAQPTTDSAGTQEQYHLFADLRVKALVSQRVVLLSTRNMLFTW